MLFGLESFERLEPCVEVRIEEFNEVGVVWCVLDEGIGEELAPSTMNVHDDLFSHGIAFAALRENVVERLV